MSYSELILREVGGVLEWKHPSFWHLLWSCETFKPTFFIAIDVYSNISAVLGILIYSYVIYCYSSRRNPSSNLAPDQQLIFTLAVGVLISSLVSLIGGRILVLCNEYQPAFSPLLTAIMTEVRLYFCDSMYYFLLLLVATYRYSFSKNSYYCCQLFAEWKSMKYLVEYLIIGIFFVTASISLLRSELRFESKFITAFYSMYLIMWHLFYVITLSLLFKFYYKTTKNILKRVERKSPSLNSTLNSEAVFLLNENGPIDSEDAALRSTKYVKHLKKTIIIGAPILIANYICWAIFSFDRVRSVTAGVKLIFKDENCFFLDPSNETSATYGMIVDMSLILSYALTQAVDTLMKVHILLLMRTNEQFKCILMLPLRELLSRICQ